MSRFLLSSKLWLVALAVFVAGAGSVFFWQQLHAQSPGTMPSPTGVTTPGAAPGVATSATTPQQSTQSTEPTVPLRSVLPSGVKVMKVKNWDGHVTELLRFKYKTIDGRTITVHLPSSYKSQQMTKAGWDTLFQVFSMDKEAALEEREKKRIQSIPPELIAQYASELASAARNMANQLDQYAQSNTSNPAAGAMDLARSSLPSMGMQLPPLMPTTPAGAAIMNP
ncbi:MAG: hypothetical protein ACPL7O_05925 [Armatimonadota bacterium]